MLDLRLPNLQCATSSKQLPCRPQTEVAPLRNSWSPLSMAAWDTHHRVPLYFSRWAAISPLEECQLQPSLLLGMGWLPSPSPSDSQYLSGVSVIFTSRWSHAQVCLSSPLSVHPRAGARSYSTSHPPRHCHRHHLAEALAQGSRLNICSVTHPRTHPSPLAALYMN